MDLLLKTIVFFIGASVGSFLNVCILRLPKGESLVKPRSRCNACKTLIPFYHNIPILSYLILRGKCHSCGHKFSPRYMLVELLSALLTLALWYYYPFDLRFFIYFLLTSILLLLIFIDLDHWLLPDIVTLPGAALGFLLSFINPDLTWTSSLFGALAGFALFFAVSWGFAKIAGKEGLGGGDVKLMLLLGAFLGLPSILFITFLSAFQGVIIGGTIILIYSRRETNQNQESTAETPSAEPPSESGEEIFVPPPTAIPYGPFLALAAIEYIFAGEWIINWYLGMIRF